MTPRKSQRRHNSSSQARPIPVSDYDSDIHYSAPPSVPHPNRDPASINYTVIKRYVPSLTTILAIAASAAIYILTPDDSPAGAEWKRAEIEGTLFVCALESSPLTGAERHCVVVLNRKGMDNLIIESGEIDNVEITPEFLILKFIRGDREEQIMGFYIQSTMYPREHICQLIQQHWEAAKVAHESLGGSYGQEVFESIEPADEFKPMGRRLSLSELFGQR